ncbi:LysR family transcriptional regulator [Methylobacterium oryzae]|uniref:LysR family transcriptional regulator n=1 Tax=Methylobacterium oryzae TaxID=334852 RepID=A0ABU7TVK6_9HYPH
MDQLASLRIFVRVVELGSFSKAAEDLRLSQSTITKNVAWLETHVGARLLNRNTRGGGPSELGLAYYERCKAVLAQLDEADGLVRGRQAELSGTLRVSTSVAFGEAVIGPLLVPFLNANPSLRIELTCEDAYVDLISRGVDVALRMGRLADSSLGSRYLGANPWVMAAAPSYLARRGCPRVPADLRDHDCIVYSSVQGDAVWPLRADVGIVEATQVHGVLRSNNLPTLLSAARAGLGIAILPRYVAETALRISELRAVMADYALPDQELYAVFPSPKLVPRKADALIRYLVPHLKGCWWRSCGLHQDRLFPEGIDDIDPLGSPPAEPGDTVPMR